MEKIALFLTTKQLTDQKIRNLLKKIPEKRQEEFFKEKRHNENIKFFDLKRNDFDQFIETLNTNIKKLHNQGQLFWAFLMDGEGSVRVWAV